MAVDLLLSGAAYGDGGPQASKVCLGGCPVSDPDHADSRKTRLTYDVGGNLDQAVPEGLGLIEVDSALLTVRGAAVGIMCEHHEAHCAIEIE